jgi:hypothetical protein
MRRSISPDKEVYTPSVCALTYAMTLRFSGESFLFCGPVLAARLPFALQHGRTFPVRHSSPLGLCIDEWLGSFLATCRRDGGSAHQRTTMCEDERTRRVDNTQSGRKGVTTRT